MASDRVYIVISPDQHCQREPGAECMTLQQYINYNSNSSIPMPNEVTLELQSGIHTIWSNLPVSNISSFTMSGRNATVLCDNQNTSQFLDFAFIHFVKLNGINFTSCSLLVSEYTCHSRLSFSGSWCFSIGSYNECNQHFNPQSTRTTIA